MDSALSNANNIGHVYYFIIIPIGIIAYAVYMFFRLKGDRQRKQDWLAAHPKKQFDFKKTYASDTGHIRRRRKTDFLYGKNGKRIFRRTGNTYRRIVVFKNTPRVFLPKRYDDVCSKQTGNHRTNGKVV